MFGLGMKIDGDFDETRGFTGPMGGARAPRWAMSRAIPEVTLGQCCPARHEGPRRGTPRVRQTVAGVLPQIGWMVGSKMEGVWKRPCRLRTHAYERTEHSYWPDRRRGDEPRWERCDIARFRL
jgi:hypothetical protein